MASSPQETLRPGSGQARFFKIAIFCLFIAVSFVYKPQIIKADAITVTGTCVDDKLKISLNGTTASEDFSTDTGCETVQTTFDIGCNSTNTMKVELRDDFAPNVGFGSLTIYNSTTDKTYTLSGSDVIDPVTGHPFYYNNNYSPSNPSTYRNPQTNRLIPPDYYTILNKNLSDMGLCTTGTTPSITISVATNVTSDSADLNGEVVNTGGEDPTVTMYWGLEDGSQPGKIWQNISDSLTSPSQQPVGQENFYQYINNLAPDTTYYFSASGDNSYGTTNSIPPSRYFRTLPATPSDGVCCYCCSNGSCQGYDERQKSKCTTDCIPCYMDKNDPPNTVGGPNLACSTPTKTKCDSGQCVQVSDGTGDNSCSMANNTPAGDIIDGCTCVPTPIDGECGPAADGPTNNSKTYLATDTSFYINPTPYVWVTDSYENNVSRIDTTTGAITAYSLGAKPNECQDFNTNTTITSHIPDWKCAAHNAADYQAGNYLVKGVCNAVSDCDKLIYENESGGAVDSSGNFWTTSLLEKKIVRITPSGTKTTFSAGLNLHLPYGVAIDTSKTPNRIWVTDVGTYPDLNDGKVIQINPDTGALLGTYQVHNPADIAIDGFGNAWVASYENAGTVTKITPSGCKENYAVPVGNGPSGVTVDALGYVWVSNYGNLTTSPNSIMRIDPSKLPTDPSAITSYSSPSLGLNYPTGIIADASGNIWVNGETHTDPYSVKKFNHSGGLLGSYTVGPNSEGMAIDASGNAWSISAGDGRVVKLDSNGNLLNTYHVDPYNRIYSTNGVGNPTGFNPGFCNSGNVSGAYPTFPNASSNYSTTWTCQGANNGADADCAAVIAPQCGAANNQTYTNISLPLDGSTINGDYLCGPGNAYPSPLNIPLDGGMINWQCYLENGTEPSDCQAYFLPPPSSTYCVDTGTDAGKCMTADATHPADGSNCDVTNNDANNHNSSCVKCELNDYANLTGSCIYGTPDSSSCTYGDNTAGNNHDLCPITCTSDWYTYDDGCIDGLITTYHVDLNGCSPTWTVTETCGDTYCVDTGTDAGKCMTADAIHPADGSDCDVSANDTNNHNSSCVKCESDSNSDFTGQCVYGSPDYLGCTGSVVPNRDLTDCPPSCHIPSYTCSDSVCVDGVITSTCVDNSGNGYPSMITTNDCSCTPSYSNCYSTAENSMITTTCFADSACGYLPWTETQPCSFNPESCGAAAQDYSISDDSYSGDFCDTGDTLHYKGNAVSNVPFPKANSTPNAYSETWQCVSPSEVSNDCTATIPTTMPTTYCDPNTNKCFAGPYDGTDCNPVGSDCVAQLYTACENDICVPSPVPDGLNCVFGENSTCNPCTGADCPPPSDCPGPLCLCLGPACRCTDPNEGCTGLNCTKSGPPTCVCSGPDCRCSSRYCISATNLSMNPDYCNSALAFGWNYSGSITEDHSELNIAIDNQTAPDGKFINLAFPTIRIRGTGNSTPLHVVAGGNPLQNELDFDKTYFWQARVCTSASCSEWSYGGTFTTPIHAWPSPAFTVTTTSPLVNKNITFSDNDVSDPLKPVQSTCYNNSDNPYCNAPGNINTYKWTFNDTVNNTSIDKGSASHTYKTPGTKSVTLEICDPTLATLSDPTAGCCPVTNPVSVKTGLNVPNWQEISPF